MTIHILNITVMALGVITLVYKAIPFRNLPEVPPRFSLLPKYRTSIEWRSPAPDGPAIEKMFAGSGFKLFRADENGMRFQRGQLFGDFSLKLAKLDCTISLPKNGSSSLTIEAGWLIAFDTGDLCTLTSELKKNLQSEVA